MKNIARVREEGIQLNSSSLLNSEHTVSCLKSKTKIPTCCRIVRIRHHSIFPPSSFPPLTQSITSTGMCRIPAMSAQCRQHKVEVLREAGEGGKALATKAHLSVRSSSVRVKLEQLTTIQQEKLFSGDNQRQSGSHHPLSAFIPTFVRALCHLEEFDTHFPVPLQGAPRSTGTGWQSVI